MGAGRPKEFNPSMIEKGYEWLNSRRDGIGRDGRPIVKLPTIEGLALCLNVSRDSIYKWSDENEEFSDMVDEVRIRQAERLIENGLSGRYNVGVTKLMLGKHGYQDKQEIDHTSKGEKISENPVIHVYHTGVPIARSEEEIDDNRPDV